MAATIPKSNVANVTGCRSANSRPLMRGPVSGGRWMHWGRRIPNLPTGGTWSTAVAAAATSTAAHTEPAAVNQQLQQPAKHATTASPDQKGYSYTSNWYPVMPLDCLDSKVPTPVEVLNKKLVVWADKSGAWHCVEDRCPHRLAPLSEGRVSEAGNLQCSYHGWEFTAAGSCARIPQLDDPKAHATACASQRACVAAYPTKEQYGLLWVWPEGGAQGAAAAAVRDIPHYDLTGKTKWFIRDLPIRYDMLLENLLDPSHVPWSHHGVMGNRNIVAPTNMTTTPVTAQGFTTTVQGVKSPFAYNIHFSAPHCVQYDLKFTGTINMVAVPTRPGWSRLFLLNPITNIYLPRAILGWAQKWPWLFTMVTALDHATTRNDVFDGDTYMLHIAEREVPLSAGLGAGLSRAYYMPSNNDVAVVGLRQWFEKFAGAPPTCQPGEQTPQVGKEQVFDRWAQHVKHCSHCKAGLAALDSTSTASIVIGALAAVTGVALAVLAAIAPATAAASSSAVPAPVLAATLLPILACALIAAASASAYTWLQAQRPRFFYKDYVHAGH